MGERIVMLHRPCAGDAAQDAHHTGTLVHAGLQMQPSAFACLPTLTSFDSTPGLAWMMREMLRSATYCSSGSAPAVPAGESKLQFERSNEAAGSSSRNGVCSSSGTGTAAAAAAAAAARQRQDTQMCPAALTQQRDQRRRQLALQRALHALVSDVLWMREPRRAVGREEFSCTWLCGAYEAAPCRPGQGAVGMA